MTTKTKIILAVSTLGLILILAVASIVAIYATSQQEFLTKTTANFVASNVEAEASANFYVGQNSKMDMVSSTGGNTLVFGKENPSNNATLQPEKALKLSVDVDYVVFEYAIKNTSLTEEFLATLIFNGEAENVTVTMAQDEAELADFRAIIVAKTSSSNFTASGIVKPNSTQYFYVKVAVSNKENSASFVGNFSWALNG